VLAGDMERAMMKVHAKPPRPKPVPAPKPAPAPETLPITGTDNSPEGSS
jgi:PTH1 family peptidyl-tRNA hydrolase